MPGYLDQVGQPFRDSFLLLIKRLNLVWALLLFLGLWATSQLVIAPLLAAHWFTCVQMLAVNHYFVAKVISEMDTELIAGATLVGLVRQLQADRRTSVRWLFVAGVVFGLLALIKSSGLMWHWSCFRWWLCCCWGPQASGIAVGCLPGFVLTVFHGCCGTSCNLRSR